MIPTRINRVVKVVVVDVQVYRIDSHNRSILLVQLFNLPKILEFVWIDIVVEFIPKCCSGKLWPRELRQWREIYSIDEDREPVERPCNGQVKGDCA